jgi:hypothetical protein
MYGLISCLYNKKNQEAFKKLYLDSELRDQMLLRSTIAEALKDCPRILESHGADWILCSLASYHKSEDDTMRIYAGIMRHLESFSIGLLTDDIKWKDLNRISDECLVGIGFFRKYLEGKNKRKASPSVEYYSKVGAVAFDRLGFETIAKDFSGWTDFIEKELSDISII